MQYVYIITADPISDDIDSDASHKFATTDMHRANAIIKRGRNQLPQFRWTWESIPLDSDSFESSGIDFMLSRLSD
jgi:hypothetical protein